MICPGYVSVPVMLFVYVVFLYVMLFVQVMSVLGYALFAVAFWFRLCFFGYVICLCHVMFTRCYVLVYVIVLCYVLVQVMLLCRLCYLFRLNYFLGYAFLCYVKFSVMLKLCYLIFSHVIFMLFSGLCYLGLCNRFRICYIFRICYFQIMLFPRLCIFSVMCFVGYVIFLLCQSFLDYVIF